MQPTADELAAKYKDFADVCASYGFAWEPYTVVTEDGWELTLFHITGKIDVIPEDSEAGGQLTFSSRICNQNCQ